MVYKKIKIEGWIDADEDVDTLTLPLTTLGRELERGVGISTTLEVVDKVKDVDDIDEAKARNFFEEE